MIFGEYFFKKKVRKMIEQSGSRKRRYCSLGEAGSVLVLFRNEDKDRLKKQLEELRSLNAKVHCCVTGDKAADGAEDPSVLYIDKSADVDKYGMPKPEVANRVFTIPADILIDLSRGKCRTLKVLMLQHPSAFKTGEKLSDNSFCDFSIVMTEGGGTTELFEYLLFYLQTIRSK